jgi:hypothetical protein
MRFDVYCDESGPDLLVSKRPHGRYLVIGSLWLATEDRDRFKQEVHALRDRHRVGGEIKWQKVSPAKIAFYLDLVSWFLERENRLRFRCIAVDREKVSLLRYHDNDQELGFYKFYYQMVHHWILDFNDYSIFCDFKSNRLRNRLHTLQRCLACSNLSSQISTVQAVRSRESLLIQCADVLTGAAAARLNNVLAPGSAKSRLVAALEEGLGRSIHHSPKGEQKFNVFVIDLAGGW